MLEELPHRGYTVSPGTLYPVLRRMETREWLQSRGDPQAGPRARRKYHLSSDSHQVLNVVSTLFPELRGEVQPSRRRDRRR
jgi:DNA-binding PadR family transcriptional regulator